MTGYWNACSLAKLGLGWVSGSFSGLGFGMGWLDGTKFAWLGFRLWWGVSVAKSSTRESERERERETNIYIYTYR